MAHLDTNTYLPDMKRIYAEMQQHIAIHQDWMRQYLQGAWGSETPRWYECGEVYQSRTEEAICRKYAGHPGRHAKRRLKEPTT